MIDTAALDTVVRRFRMMLHLARVDRMGEETRHLAILMRPLIVQHYRELILKTGDQNGMDDEYSTRTNNRDQRS
jgi:hypothetical protein